MVDNHKYNNSNPSLNKNEGSFYISREAKMGKNVLLSPGCKILGRSIIEDNCKIGAGTVIDNCKIAFGCNLDNNCNISNSSLGQNCQIKCSYIEDSVVGNGCSVGPFAHLRPNSHLGLNVKVGNFCEVKNSNIGDNTKLNHLAYVGDADVGKDCNIGCGVIFANYNGRIKSRTFVGDNCFIGSNCNLIAPVVLADGTYVCAGTTVTESTAENDFVIGRVRQSVKPNRPRP